MNNKLETPVSIAVDTKDQDILDIIKPETRNLVHEKLRRIRLSRLEESLSHEVLNVLASFTPEPHLYQDEVEADVESIIETDSGTGTRTGNGE